MSDAASRVTSRPVLFDFNVFNVCDFRLKRISASSPSQRKGMAPTAALAVPTQRALASSFNRILMAGF